MGLLLVEISIQNLECHCGKQYQLLPGAFQQLPCCGCTLLAVKL